MSYRIMIEGEDRTLWCEVNNKSYDWCEVHGDELCEKYENAQWFIENEDPFVNSWNDQEEYF